MNPSDYIAAAQVYATLSQGWRIAQATIVASSDRMPKPILEQKANEYEAKAIEALQASGAA